MDERINKVFAGFVGKLDNPDDFETVVEYLKHLQKFRLIFCSQSKHYLYLGSKKMVGPIADVEEVVL